MTIECDDCGNTVTPVDMGWNKCCPECGAVIADD